MSSSAPLVAVIEDEAPIRRFLRASLTAEGFQVVEAETFKDGVRLVTQQIPALVLMDLGLPDGDGIDLVREIRGWSPLPVIVISARGQENAKIAALDAGADDYLTKPFSMGELLARIRVALRHAAKMQSSEPQQRVLSIGDLEIDLESHVVQKSGEEIKLTKIEFDLLAVLTRNSGKVVTHRQFSRKSGARTPPKNRITFACSWPTCGRSWKPTQADRSC